MEEKQPFCKWASDEANRFYEILADAENNFVETLKKHPAENYLIP